MKHVLRVFAFLLLVLFLFTAISAMASPVLDSLASGNTIVFITRTGSKYHRDGCGSLSRSQIEITLKEAVEQGYGPCKRCNPPRL